MVYDGGKVINDIVLVYQGYMATKLVALQSGLLDFTTNPERDAYFLGFFYADGYNSEKKGRVVVALAGKDEAFLQGLSNSLHVSHRRLSHGVYKGHSRVTMSISDRPLSRRLAELGAPQKKTFLLKWPTFLSAEMERHFMRGHFDGDGSCLHMKSRGRDLLDRAIHIPGTLAFLTGIQAVILREVGIEAGIIPFGKISLLHFGGNRQSLRFLAWLYEDCRYHMQRKKDRYLRLKQEVAEIDARHTMVVFDESKERWYGRLPNQMGRVNTGMATTREEALIKWQTAMDAIQRTSLEEWLKNRPQAKRGPTRKHVKEQGVAEGRYLRKNGT